MILIDQSSPFFILIVFRRSAVRCTAPRSVITMCWRPKAMLAGKLTSPTGVLWVPDAGTFVNEYLLRNYLSGEKETKFE